MIRMIGIDHDTAPLEIRSVFAFTKDEMIGTMAGVKEELEADGVVLLSTCNRMELWVSGGSGEDMYSALCRAKGVDSQEYRVYFSAREEDEAIHHLFLLTCGLKSAILAEDQILTQVKDALNFARTNSLSDSVLEVLFRMAVTAAKKVKTDVVFKRSNATAIGQAIEMLQEQDFTLPGKRCMVIGNGEYGRLVAQTLKEHGADVTVTLRQYHSGAVQIPEGCHIIPYDDKLEYFPLCDLVVSATSSPNYTLLYDQVKDCEVQHPIILLDFAVPRDIDLKIRELPDYTLYDIDDFRTGSNEENKEAYRQAEQILNDQMAEFHLWMDYRDVMPCIGHIRDAAVHDIELRLTKTLHKLPVEKADEEHLVNRIEDASGKVVSKLLYMLRDELDLDTFRRCVVIIENAYVNEGVPVH